MRGSVRTRRIAIMCAAGLTALSLPAVAAPVAAGAATTTVSPSQDGAQSRALNPAAATISGDDREWIAADDSHQQLGLPVEGGDKVCISYHDLAGNINVDCSYSGGTAFTQHSQAIDA